MYSVFDYAAMIADTRRVEAYAAALKAAIRPDSVVVEIGTGIGVFAILARQFGARRVIAVEPNDAIDVARLLATQNGVDDIEFVHGVARDVMLAEKADILVSDLRGALPIAMNYLSDIIDARNRLLAPGGIMIPTQDRLRVAVVEAPRLHMKRTPTCVVEGIEVDLAPIGRLATNLHSKAKFEKGELLTAPQSWAVIDYRTLDTPDVSGSAELMADRRGTGHGLAVWFETTLFDTVGFSGAPGEPELIYGSLFFPWSAPVEIEAGDRIAVRLGARQMGEDYVWRWDTDVRTAESSAASNVRFQQSTFFGVPFEPAKLRKSAHDHAPHLTRDGEIEAFILQAMDGHATNQAIGERVMVRFPDTFRRLEEAIARVADVARRFSAG